MSDIIKVSQKRPCPICNHADWCMATTKKHADSSFPPEDGYNYLCHRKVAQLGEAVFGADGKEYVCWKISEGGESWFETRSAHDRFSGRRSKRYSPKTREVKEELPVEQSTQSSILPAERLDEINRLILSYCPLTQEHRRYLNGEGISDDLIASWGISSMPAYWQRDAMMAALVKNYPDLTGFPGAAYVDGRWKIVAPQGIIFPAFGAYGNIMRLRIRLDAPYVCEGRWITKEEADRAIAQGKEVCLKGKYMPVSSPPEKYVKGTSSGVFAGVFAQNCTSLRICWIIEGEKKCIIWNAITGNPCVCLPGVTTLAALFERTYPGNKCLLDILWECGVEILVIAFDADKNFNELVLRAERVATQRIKEYGFSVGIASWKQAMGKGIDDFARTCLGAGKKPEREIAMRLV